LDNGRIGITNLITVNFTRRILVHFTHPAVVSELSKIGAPTFSISPERFVLSEEVDFSVTSGGASGCPPVAVGGRSPPASVGTFFFDLLDSSLKTRGNIELVGVGWT